MNPGDISGHLNVGGAICGTILETTPNPYVLKNSDSVYVYVNRAFADFVARPREEIVGKTDYDLFPAEEARKYVAGDRAVLAGGRQQESEWLVPGARGPLWLQVLKTPVRDSDGRVVGVLCSVADISELKAALKQVKVLSGLLPICAYCKKVRDDKGYWNAIERYLSEHSDAEFSHGICPECAARANAELDEALNDES